MKRMIVSKGRSRYVIAIISQEDGKQYWYAYLHRYDPRFHKAYTRCESWKAIGFDDKDEAEEACRYFNNDVEQIIGLRDPSKHYSFVVTDVYSDVDDAYTFDDINLPTED